MEVITNHKWRDTVFGTDLPEKVRKDFDYISDEDLPEVEFVHYRGTYYDLREFTVCHHELKDMGWEAFKPDSYYSGIVFKMDKYGAIKVGRYYVG